MQDMTKYPTERWGDEMKRLASIAEKTELLIIISCLCGHAVTADEGEGRVLGWWLYGGCLTVHIR